MVRRHPHNAGITIKTGGSLVNGEWVEGGTHTVEIIGRYDPMNTNDVVRQNANGDEVIVNGEFYTQQDKLEGAVSLKIPSLRIDRNIICWWTYQNHSVISL